MHLGDWTGADHPEDDVPKPKKPKVTHSAAARVWVRWMWISLGLMVLAGATLVLGIWLPSPYGGATVGTSIVIAALSIPGWIIATMMWSRVPRHDEAWCTTLGLAEVKEVD